MLPTCERKRQAASGKRQAASGAPCCVLRCWGTVNSNKQTKHAGYGPQCWCWSMESARLVLVLGAITREIRGQRPGREIPGHTASCRLEMGMCQVASIELRACNTPHAARCTLAPMGTPAMAMAMVIWGFVRSWQLGHMKHKTHHAWCMYMHAHEKPLGWCGLWFVSLILSLIVAVRLPVGCSMLGHLHSH